MQKAPIIGLSRHRLSVDGEGVTTLVAFHGCPLSCRYCINSSCLHPGGILREVSTESLLEEVSIDHLYFLATGGGVTFGGGEPCLRSHFIEEFCGMKDSRWRITMESSLHVSRGHLERLLSLADHWIIDIKDMDPDTYHRYTTAGNTLVKDNLRWMLSHPGMDKKITVRLPLIPDFNTPEAVAVSRRQLEEMGVTTFDEFTYERR